MPDEVFCVNCLHCKIFRMPVDDKGRYVYRLRCAKNHWKKPGGDEKVYKLFTAHRRIMDCKDYEGVHENPKVAIEAVLSIQKYDEIYLEGAKKRPRRS